MRVKSYLHEKIFDANIVKFETYKKTKEEHEKAMKERQTIELELKNKKDKVFAMDEDFIML